MKSLAIRPNPASTGRGKCLEIAFLAKKTVHMDGEQVSFLMPFGEGLNPNNRWVRMARLVPWQMVQDAYGRHFTRSSGTRPLSARVALGALIIKERLGLTDRETVEQIRENPYLQYFLGFGSFSDVAPFDASLMVHFRKRLGAEVVVAMNDALIHDRVAAVLAEREQDHDGPSDDLGAGGDPGGGTSPSASSGSRKGDSPDDPRPDGRLIIDATCAPADITYPTDLKVINQAREVTERIIDDLHAPHVGAVRRPRTYRKRARLVFVGAMKTKRMTQQKRRVMAGRLLRFLRRNLRIIDRQVGIGQWDLRRLQRSWYTKLLVAAEVARQQSHLLRSREWSIPDRIVSVSQPHVRPIVRGKAGVPVEFGAKLSASWIHGYASLDRMSWDAYAEGHDLPMQAEAYRRRAGRYPAVIHADKAYTTRANRAWCAERGIRLAGLGPGRPPTDPVAARERLRQARNDESARQPIEGIFGRAKRRWSLNRIMAKLAGTSATVIALVFLVMNLEAILLPLCAVAFLIVVAVALQVASEADSRRLVTIGCSVLCRMK